MDAYIGEIVHNAYGQAPKGTLPCDGRTMTLTGSDPMTVRLYAALGIQSGVTFPLPDLRGRSPLDKSATDCHYFIVTDGYFPG